MADHETDTGSYRERLARIEEWSLNMNNRMDIVQVDIRAIRTALDQMNGGKRVAFAIFAAIGAITTFIVAVAGLVKLFAKIP